MAKPSLGAPAPSPFFSPAPDQSNVSHLRVTVQSVTPNPDGSLQLAILGGNIRFGLAIFNLPGRPEYKPGDTLILEYPKGHNPLTDYSAIYHADQFPPPPKPKKDSMSTITTTTVQTMSSLELVQIINELREEGKAELRHSDFMVKLEKHPGIDSPKFSGQYKDSTGRTLKCYYLPKRECELMVMSESLQVQTKVYDRMTALEQQALQGGCVSPAPVAALPKPTREFKDYYGIAKLIGLDKNAAAIAANQAVIKLTGTDVLQLLEQKQMQAEKQDTQWFTPTELGARLNISARAFNLLLAEAGLQMKRGEVWEVTDAGREFARLYDTGKKHGSGVPIQQIKWSPSVTDLLKTDAQKEAA